ncbi:Protein of unknown function [Gryllus bimaculatus]|nr:Protein of unknown function [Gryllus bimaculatus]
MVNIKEVSKKPIFLIKVVELVLTCVCIRCVGGQYAALLRRERPEDDDNDYKGVFPLMTAMWVQLVVYSILLVFLLVVIICLLTDRPMHYKIVITLAGIATVIFVAGSAINFEVFFMLFEAKKKTLVGAVAGLLNGAVYVTDILLTYRDAK